MDALPKEARKSPLALGGPPLARQTVRVHSDPATQVEAETPVIANPWFRFSRSIAMRDGTLVIVGEWQRFTDRIPANGVARAASDMERARPAVLPSRSQAATARAATRPACAQLPAGRVNRLGGAAGGMSALVTRMPQHAGLRWSAWAVFAATTLLSAWVWLHALPLWAKAGGVIVVVAIAVLGCVLLR